MPQTMKVKLKARVAGVTIRDATNDGSTTARVGDVLEVPEAQAKQWIRAGIATANLQEQIEVITDPALLRARKKAKRKGLTTVVKPMPALATAPAEARPAAQANARTSI